MTMRNMDGPRQRALSRSKEPLACGVILAALLIALPARAADCQFIGGPLFGGVEAPLMVDATCTDPDYNEKTFVEDSSEQKTLQLPDGSAIAYTEVKGHFPALRSLEELPVGVTQSPLTAKHSVTWRFPERKYWRNRFFQQSYPLPQDFLNTVDERFAFTNGGYTVAVSSENANAGYRVIAAAAKLAKLRANRLYANTAYIYGYIYGQSGGSVQMMGANEGTTGVWDGIVPVVIATDGLNTHSFMWDGLYALGVPEAKRKAIAEAVAPGSGGDIYAGLSAEERSVVDELLNAGFPRIGLEFMQFSVSSSTFAGSTIRLYDPTYEEDFWTKPGYEGVNPPTYLTAAKVDGYATISGITRNDKNVPVSITFDPATVPALGSIGAVGLQFYLYAADGKTQVTKGEAYSLSGKLEGNTLKLDDGKSDPVLLAALANGGKVRINNRFVLACAFYPRHSILDNGSPAYDQYKNADGTPKYVQRPRTPIAIPYLANLRTSGGLRETGHLRVKTIVIENLSDTASYPLVGGLYAELVRQAMGPRQTDQNFRIYYQENAGHGAFLNALPGKLGTSTVAVGGILNQALLDLTDWVEKGLAPRAATRYGRDAMNQVILPAKASARGGHQPVITLTANGKERADVGVNEPVNLAGTIEMPPGAGKVVQYEWYLGGADLKFEPATKLARPVPRVTVARTATFTAPGEYVITLRATGQRNGVADPNSMTPLQNIHRARVVVR